MVHAAQRQQAPRRWRAPAAKPPPSVLQGVPQPLQRRVARQRQLIPQERGPRAAALAQEARDADDGVHVSEADMIAAADTAVVRDLHVVMVDHIILLAD